jgi:dipeptidyl aminopeptidase/acylaminoacyl peptidase
MALHIQPGLKMSAHAHELFTLIRQALLLGTVLMLAGEVAGRLAAQEIRRDILLTTSLARSPDLAPQIYRANADGSGRKLLISGADPVLSPDGKQIAFVAPTEENKRIVGLYVMNLNGSGRKRLAERASGEMALAPSWSPDGKRIAFCTVMGPDKVRAARGGLLFQKPQLYFVDADGLNLKRLEAVEGLMPVWSPDGKRLLFTRLLEEARRCSLCVVDADGTNERELIRDATMGAWSPDGQSLAYLRGGLYIAPADGSKARWLAGRRDEEQLGLRWSTDGKRLFFTRVIPTGKTGKDEPGGKTGRDEPSERIAVYVIDITGRNLHRVTAGDEQECLGGTILLR